MDWGVLWRHFPPGVPSYLLSHLTLLGTLLQEAFPDVPGLLGPRCLWSGRQGQLQGRSLCWWPGPASQDLEGRELTLARGADSPPL